MPNYSYVATDGSDALSVTLPDNTVSARHDNLGRKRQGTTAAPTSAVGAGAGASATTSVAGTDEVGVVTVGTGASGTAAGTLATVTFNTAYKTAPIVLLIAGDAVSAAAELYATSTTTTFVVKAAGTPGTSSSLKINYLVIGGA